MSRLGDWFRREYSGAPAGVKTKPIVINPNASQRLSNAAYRVDAIRRYIEQTEHIPAEKMRQLYAEMVEHVNLLFKEGQTDLFHHDAMIKLVEDAKARFARIEKF